MQEQHHYRSPDCSPNGLQIHDRWLKGDRTADAGLFRAA